MDDVPRIGGAQALFLLIGAPATYVAVATGWWPAAVVAVFGLSMVVWLEWYGRKRRREDREEAERRVRRTSIDHLDFDSPPGEHDDRR